MIRALVVASLATYALALPTSAQQLDVIRGQVVGPEGKPLEDAKVTATSLSGNVNRTARTDKNGRYTITFPGGEGDYFVEFSAIGDGARRFEVKRTADQDILVADAKLLRAAGQLETVKITGQRERVDRNDATPDISGSERPVDNSALSPDQQGDIAAMAASLPGVTLVPGQDGDPSGFSVLGLSPDQNNTTLNGMQFGGSNLPRDAAVSTSLVTTPYDVSGQFARDGVPQQITMRTGPDGPPAGGRRDGPALGGNTTVTAVGPGAGGLGGQLPPLTMISPSELPDYKPAFAPGSTRADADGNLWIRTSQNLNAIPVYNVVNRKGELIDRVQLPQNRVLVGFGPGGVVYLGVRDGATAHLEKARTK